MKLRISILVALIMLGLNYNKLNASNLVFSPSITYVGGQRGYDDLMGLTFGLGYLGLNYYYQGYVEFMESSMYYDDYVHPSYKALFTGIEIGYLTDNATVNNKGFRWYARAGITPNNQIRDTTRTTVDKVSANKEEGTPDIYTTTYRLSKTQPLYTSELALGYKFYDLSFFALYRYNYIKTSFLVEQTVTEVLDKVSTVTQGITPLRSYSKSSGYGYIGIRVSYDVNITYKPKNSIWR